MTERTIIPQNHSDYRTWVYNKIDGEMTSKIVSAAEATELYKEGWRMTPAEFTDDENLKEDPAFQAITDDMAVIMNTLINIDNIDDKQTLMDFSKNFLQMEIPAACKIGTIKKRINTKAIELGLFD